MVKCSGISFKISTVIFVVFSLIFTKGIFTTMSAIAGEEIKLNFSYLCDSARFTLQNGYRPPFYDSANLESLSLPDNLELTFQNETESNNCLLQLTINPVLRSDEGGYILTAYDGDGNLLEDTRVSLRVEYPPGKASCQWGDSKADDDMVSMMRCKASAGSMQGQIACFQNGTRLPPTGEPRDGDSNLEQTMWMRYSQPAFCCSIVVGKPVDRSKCKDYTWDPYNTTTESSPVDLDTAHQDVSTSSKSPTSIPSKEVPQTTKKKTCSQKIKPSVNFHVGSGKTHVSLVVLHVIYVCLIGISTIIIIFLSIALKIRYTKCKAYQVTISQPANVHQEYEGVELDER